jgi:hypothetical protein
MSIKYANTFQCRTQCRTENGLVPILPNTIFQILHIFVRFSHKKLVLPEDMGKNLQVCKLCKLQIFVPKLVTFGRIGTWSRPSRSWWRPALFRRLRGPTPARACRRSATGTRRSNSNSEMSTTFQYIQPGLPYFSLYNIPNEHYTYVHPKWP